MALETARKKLEQAREEYETKLKVMNASLQKSIVDALAPLIPEGRFLQWNQSDQQYNDESYYFGLDQVVLATVKEPREDGIKNPGKPEKKEWTGMGRQAYERVVERGIPPTWNWIIDDRCADRSDRLSSYGPGVTQLEDFDNSYEQFGLIKEACAELEEAFDRVNKRDWQHAFGNEATVRIYRDVVSL